MAFNERTLISIALVLIALLFTYLYSAAPASMNTSLPGSIVILAKPQLFPPLRDGVDLSSALRSSKASIYFRHPQTGTSLGWHMTCRQVTATCRKLLDQKNTPLEVTLVPMRGKYLISNSSESWLLYAQANGEAIVTTEEQAQFYAQERRQNRVMLAIVYLIALGAIAYAKWGARHDE